MDVEIVGLLSRFYVPEMSEGVEVIDLPQEEAHHLVRVLRLRAGEHIAVFDGRGAERRARVESADRRGARVRLLEPLTPAAEPRVAVTLAQAALKGDHMDAVVRDATMLGAAAVQPLVTRRTIARREAVRGDRARDRWLRVAIASAKQCRRAVVPEIHPGADFADWVPASLAASRGVGYLLVEPAAAVESVTIGALAALKPPSAATLLVGPEGGWDASEIDAAREAGHVPLTLGGRTLRAEAVPIVAMAALGAVWRDL